jgi:CBS domain-containing protein/sporulation protein YlmC with PRC-barrel domain
MNDIEKKFIFLSQIVKLPVINSVTGKKIGYALDFAATLKEMFPKVNALIIRTQRGKKIYLAWKHVKMVLEEKAIYVENIPENFQEEIKLAESEIQIKETFWDKQIVDIHGSKVVRVNDIHLLKEDSSLWVVHVDIGITGLIRRLGCIKFFQFFVKLLSSVELKDQLISWKYVQPIHSAIGHDALSLKVHHHRLAEIHPADLADIMVNLGSEERITILKSMDNITAADTFQSLPIKVQTQIVEAIDYKYLLDLLNEMAMDKVVDLLSQLAKKKLDSLLMRMPQEKVVQISDLLGHAQDVAGSIMNTQFITAKQTESAGAVLEKIKKEAKRKESIYYIYILDDNGILTGVITLQQLLTVLPERIISEFMRKRVAKVKIKTKVRDVAEIFYKYDFTVVPVVDKFGKIQGIITMKDAFGTVFPQIREETEEIK